MLVRYQAALMPDVAATIMSVPHRRNEVEALAPALLQEIAQLGELTA